MDRLRQETDRFGLGPSQLEAIRSIIASFGQIERAVVFGSRAMGTQKPGSDVDICVYGSRTDAEMAQELSRRLNHETTSPHIPR